MKSDRASITYNINVHVIIVIIVLPIRVFPLDVNIFERYTTTPRKKERTSLRLSLRRASSTLMEIGIVSTYIRTYVHA